MLAKVPVRSSSAGDRFSYARRGRGTFAALRSYIAEASRASVVELSSNLLSLETAAAEMASVAAQAPRCRDPVYHFVLSWQAGEIPSPAQAVAASRYALATLGMADHQHIIAVHTNTAHVHAHVAVNRVSERTYRTVGRGFDYFKLDAACRMIEVDQGWSHERGPFRIELDEAGGRRLIGPDRVFGDPAKVDKVVIRELEQWRGEQPFAGWVRGEPVRAVNEHVRRSRASWEEVHVALARFNLAYVRRAQRDGSIGGMIVDRDEPAALRMKAGAAGEEMALGRMEERLGRYRPPAVLVERAERSYRSETAPRAGTDELRERFLRDFLVATAPDRGRERNAAWRAQRESERAREETRRTVQQRTKLHEEIVKERAALRRRFATTPMPTWRGWLQREALAGDIGALGALASLGTSEKVEFDAPLAMSPGVPLPPMRAKIDGVRCVSHRQGIDYVDTATDELLVRDTGAAVFFAGRSTSAVRVGMELCRRKWQGSGVVVTGDRAFQRRARAIGQEANVNVIDSEKLAPGERNRDDLRVAEAAYAAHHADITRLAGGVVIDPSRVDRMISQRMRATGFAEPMVRAIMAQSAIAGERGAQYADRQAAYAFAPVELTGAAINEADFDRFRAVWSAIEAQGVEAQSVPRTTSVELDDVSVFEPSVFEPRRLDVDVVAISASHAKPIVERDAEPDRRVTGVLVAAGRAGERYVAVLDGGRALEVLTIDGEMARELRDRAGERFVASVLDGFLGESIVPRWSLMDLDALGRAAASEIDIAGTLGRPTSSE